VAVAVDGGDEGFAAALARELGLPMAELSSGLDDAFDLLLVVAEHRLELREVRRDAPGPIHVDFVGGAVGYRGRTGQSRRQPIALAVGLRTGTRTVIDATAGLGRDAFHLASLGCRVTAVERSAVLAALVRDGLGRARGQGDPSLTEVLDRIELIVGDAREVLLARAEAARPDVVYLDPMYTPRRKSALGKKEMRACRALVGDDPDAGGLFEVAMRVARRRVVVKRHPHAPSLGAKPSKRYVGATVRYDVYHLA
jgi:16S rRNA (guanine1516-N2)-methyltransferase